MLEDWRRVGWTGGSGRELAPRGVPLKGMVLYTRPRLWGLDLSHPLGAFNKSIQTTGGPNTCGYHRGMAVCAREWECGGDGAWRMQALSNMAMEREHTHHHHHPHQHPNHPIPTP